MKMDKRGIIKLGTGILFILLLLILVFSLFFSSASEEKSYFVGDELKLNLQDSDSCFMKIKTPSEDLKVDCENKFSFTFEEQGYYVFDIQYSDSSERLDFQVYEMQEDLGQIAAEDIILEDSYSFNFQNSNTYLLGRDLEFNFNGLGNYELTIISPSGKRTSRVGSNDVFLFEILEEGDYSMEVS